MPERLEVLEGEGIIQVISTGNISGLDLKVSRDGLVSLKNLNSYDKVFIDATGVVKVDTLDAFEHGECLCSNEALRRYKYAVLVSNNSLKDIHFIETVCCNRGAKMKLFTEKEEAISWLNS